MSAQETGYGQRPAARPDVYDADEVGPMQLLVYLWSMRKFLIVGLLAGAVAATGYVLAMPSNTATHVHTVMIRLSETRTPATIGGDDFLERVNQLSSTALTFDALERASRKHLGDADSERSARLAEDIRSSFNFAKYRLPEHFVVDFETRETIDPEKSRAILIEALNDTISFWNSRFATLTNDDIARRRDFAKEEREFLKTEMKLRTQLFQIVYGLESIAENAKIPSSVGKNPEAKEDEAFSIEAETNRGLRLAARLKNAGLISTEREEKLLDDLQTAREALMKHRQEAEQRREERLVRTTYKPLPTLALAWGELQTGTKLKPSDKRGVRLVVAGCMVFGVLLALLAGSVASLVRPPNSPSTTRR